MVCVSIPHEDSDFSIFPTLVRRRKLTIFLIWNTLHNICSFTEQDGIVSYCYSFTEFEWGLLHPEVKNKQLKSEWGLSSSARSPLPEEQRSTEQRLEEKVEEEEKVSLLMILKRPVGESHHISIVKEPHLRKIHKSWKTQRLENCIRISINSKSISNRNYYYCGVGADGLLFNSTRGLWFLYLSQACEKTKTEHISHLKYNI